jgi:hypothetical protein
VNLDPCTLDQYIRFVDMMAHQDSDPHSLSIEVLRARYRTSIIVAKMIKQGIDVFDISGEDTKKALEDYEVGRYYTIESGKASSQPTK